MAIGALTVGPLLRRFGATWRSDVIATRFPAWPVRLASGVAVVCAALLTAYAGFHGAADVVSTQFGVSRPVAGAIVAAAILLGSAPGGAASLVASGAAGAAALFAMMATAIVLQGGLELNGLSASLAGAGPDSARRLTALALALGSGGFFVLDPPALVSPTLRDALKSAREGLFLCLALGVAAVWIGPKPAPVEMTGAAVASLAEGGMLAAFLALGAVGAHGCSRAFGIVLDARPRRFPPLASVRLARMRGVQGLAIAACFAADARDLATSPAALGAAMAISLAFTLPLLALAAIRRPGSIAAGAALAVAAAIFAYRLSVGPQIQAAGALLDDALAAGAAALIAGALASRALPVRSPVETDPSGR
jgi:hypothetical protein